MNNIISFVLTSSLMLLGYWFLRFKLLSKKGKNYTFISLFFLAIVFVLVTELVNNFHCFWGSYLCRILYPAGMLSAPCFFLFFLYSCSFPYKALPRRMKYVLIIPFSISLFFGYAFYIHVTPSELAPYLSDIIRNEHIIFPRKLALIVFANKITNAMIVISMISVIMSSFYFTPKFIKKVSHRHVFIETPIVRYFIITISIVSFLAVCTIIHYLLPFFIYSNNNVLLIVSISWFAGWFIIGRTIDKLLKTIHAPDFNMQGKTNESKALIIKFEAYVQQKKAYLNPELKLEDVATNLGTNRTYLSETINKELHTNFNTFLNNLRISESEHLLKKKMTLKEVAAKSGFNSYSSFYRAFKNTTGVSPKEFTN